jgi:hypothetical protein
MMENPPFKVFMLCLIHIFKVFVAAKTGAQPGQTICFMKKARALVTGLIQKISFFDFLPRCAGPVPNYEG